MRVMVFGGPARDRPKGRRAPFYRVVPVHGNEATPLHSHAPLGAIPPRALPITGPTAKFSPKRRPWRSFFFQSLLLFLIGPWFQMAHAQKVGPHVIRWSFFHPAQVAFARSMAAEAYRLADSLARVGRVDSLSSGGTQDAFRHAYWMGRCTQKMGRRKALSLGKAHERDNARDSRRGVLEDESWADFPAQKMDLRNNELGADLGGAFPKAQDLPQAVLEALLSGKGWVLLHDPWGNFVDETYRPIPDSEWQNHWMTKRFLVPSHKGITVPE